MQETRVRSLGWEDPLEKGMTIHSSILAWRIPWKEKPGGLQFVGSQRVGHDCVTNTHTRTAGGLLRSGDYQANGGRHGEEKMFLTALSLHPKKLGRQVRNVWKICCAICHGIWQQFFSCLPATFNIGFGIPFLYRAVQTYYIFKNVSLSMLSSGTPYEIWVAHFVNPFIQEKTKGFYEFFMYGYIYVCICINM